MYLTRVVHDLHYLLICISYIKICIKSPLRARHLIQVIFIISPCMCIIYMSNQTEVIKGDLSLLIDFDYAISITPIQPMAAFVVSHVWTV